MQLKQLLKKTLIFGLGVVVVSLILSLVVGEFIVKHIYPQQTYSLARAQGLNIFEPSSLLPFTLKKNVDKFLHLAFTREFTHFASTNTHATRGHDFTDEKPQDTYRILFLGDSITFGWGVEDNEAYPVLVEKLLNPLLKKGEYKQVETINAGFTDTNSPDTYYLFYKEIGRKYNPDLVIVNFHPPNDIGDLADHSWDQVDQNQLPLKISGKTYKADNGFLVTRKKTKWKYEIPILRDWHLGILFFNALEKGAPQIVDQIERSLGIEEEKEVFNQNDIYTCIYSMKKEDCKDELWQSLEVSKQMFVALQKITSENSDALIVTHMPGPHQIVPLFEKPERQELLKNLNPQKAYAAFFKDRQFDYIDFTDPLLAQNPKDVFYHLDGHINKRGHEVVAKAIVVYLQKSKPELFDMGGVPQ